MNLCQKINLQEPQRNRNATANFVNLIRTSTVTWFDFELQIMLQDTRAFLDNLSPEKIACIK